jgi:hypothetical protein
MRTSRGVKKHKLLLAALALLIGAASAGPKLPPAAHDAALSKLFARGAP